MSQHRAIVLALLVYVTLDLSLPGMPGAFVFEPSETVDSAQGHRGRAPVDVVIARRPAEHAVLPSLTITSADRPLPSSDAPFLVGPVVRRLPRAVLESAPPADDPH